VRSGIRKAEPTAKRSRQRLGRARDVELKAALLDVARKTATAPGIADYSRIRAVRRIITEAT